MLTIPEKHVEDCMNYFDSDVQLDILQEECAELIQAVSKYKRYGKRAPLIEELTHVLVSSQIVGKLLSISQRDIDEQIQKKIDKYGF